MPLTGIVAKAEYAWQSAVDRLARVSTARLGVSLAIATGLTVACGRRFPPLRTDAAPHGIVSIEVPWTTGKAKEIVASWAEHRLVDAADRSLLIDLPFIIFYAVALGALGVLAARAAGVTGVLGDDWTRKARTLLPTAAAAAATLDLIENLGIWLMLHDHYGTGTIAPATSLASTAKWVLGGIALLAAIMMLGLAAVRAVIAASD